MHELFLCGRASKTAKFYTKTAHTGNQALPTGANWGSTPPKLCTQRWCPWGFYTFGSTNTFFAPTHFLIRPEIRSNHTNNKNEMKAEEAHQT
jgi:hypothetical protein